MMLSEEQKKIAKSIAITPLCYIPYTIIYHLIKTDTNWMDVLWFSIGYLVVAVLLIIFFLLGSKTPDK